jgi:seryl-tRNA synthetase
MRAFDGVRAAAAAVNRRSVAAVIFTAAFGSAAIGPALGQAARSGGDSSRALQQMQQLASERTALQAENEKLKGEAADLKKQLDKANAETAAAAARVKQLEAAAGRGAESGKQAAEALEKSRSQIQELITRFRATAQDLKTVETDRNALRGQHDALSRDYAACVDHNVGLYQIGRETLDRLDRHGFFSKAGESEPFTQLARARLENLIDDYRQRLEELRVEQSKKTAADKTR